MSKNKNNKYLSDYSSFISNSKFSTPEHISQKILNDIESKLNPSIWLVLTKIGVIQTIIGVLTLLLCSQFGVSLSRSPDFYHYFHQSLGEVGCIATCGAIFMSGGAAFSALLLRKEEIEIIKNIKVFFFIAFSGISLLALLAFGAGTYLTLSAVWIIAASSSSICSFELFKWFRYEIL